MVDIIDLVLPMSDRTDPQLHFNTRSGGVAMDGGEQILSPLSERWQFRAVFPIHNKSGARTIRSVKSRLKGRFNLLRLRICDQYRISRRDIGAVGGGPVPHSDGAYFSDGSDYALAQPKSFVMVPAAANSTSLVIDAIAMAGSMTIGVFFSINDWLYQIDGWTLADDGLTYTLAISPPLRDAVTTTDEADFDARCLWQLASDDEGQLDLQIGRFGAVVLNLVEPANR